MQSFTILVRKEGSQYASLCIELDVASCGHTKSEAVEGIKNAIQEYIDYMISIGRGKEIYRPVPMKDLREFLFGEEVSREKGLKALTMDFQYA